MSAYDPSAVVAAAAAAVLALAALLRVLSMLLCAYTALRRSVRNARLLQRSEGWGASKDANQVPTGFPSSPGLEVVEHLLKASRESGSPH